MTLETLEMILTFIPLVVAYGLLIDCLAQILGVILSCFHPHNQTLNYTCKMLLGANSSFPSSWTQL